MRGELLEGLKKFGLNPREWRIYFYSKNVLVVNDKANLKFKGSVKYEKGRWDWGALELLSL